MFDEPTPSEDALIKAIDQEIDEARNARAQTGYSPWVLLALIAGALSTIFQLVAPGLQVQLTFEIVAILVSSLLFIGWVNIAIMGFGQRAHARPIIPPSYKAAAFRTSLLVSTISLALIVAVICGAVSSHSFLSPLFGTLLTSFFLSVLILRASCYRKPIRKGRIRADPFGVFLALGVLSYAIALSMSGTAFLSLMLANPLETKIAAMMVVVVTALTLLSATDRADSSALLGLRRNLLLGRIGPFEARIQYSAIVEGLTDEEYLFPAVKEVIEANAEIRRICEERFTFLEPYTEQAGLMHAFQQDEMLRILLGQRHSKRDLIAQFDRVGQGMRYLASLASALPNGASLEGNVHSALEADFWSIIRAFDKYVTAERQVLDLLDLTGVDIASLQGKATEVAPPNLVEAALAACTDYAETSVALERAMWRAGRPYRSRPPRWKRKLALRARLSKRRRRSN